jgi:transposase InsO family protein
LPGISKHYEHQRLGHSENGTQRLRATRINEVWSYDFVFDQTEDGRRLKWLPICDEFSRESVALEVERRMESADVIRILDAAVSERGEAPEFIRSANGTFLTDKGRRTFWEEWFRRLDTEVSHPEFSYKMAYRRMLEVQGRQLWRFVRGEALTYHGFVTR